MQRGKIDMCIVGTDRTLSNGDVCNKIGTYLKALSQKIITFLFMLHYQVQQSIGILKITNKYLLKRETLKNYLTLKELMKITILKK